MAIKLYWGSGSPFAWRVMLMLEVKGLAYESKLLEFSKGEHKGADYLRLNPRGKVPTLQDDDFVLYESLAIMTYLDRRYPEPPIFGSIQKPIAVAHPVSRLCSTPRQFRLNAGECHASLKE